MNIAILGAGKVGAAIARVALGAGHHVMIAGSGGPADIELLVSVVAPGAVVASVADAVQGADVVILSIPSPKFQTLDPGLLAGKVVVDAMNYWPETDGVVPELLHEGGSSRVVATHLAGSRVVKTLNHVGYHELEDYRAAADTPGRRALAVVSDDADAAATVATLIESIGYEPVAATPLAAGLALQPGAALFGGPFGKDEVIQELVAVSATIIPADAAGAQSARGVDSVVIAA
ncbi:NADPH-dependent F420 reductase [Microbacterium sp. P05]|uniref:NADPH-dependent F420 reductase n=1 Tax=Microbacterium sp. P05 TaxID=3366948 RepID=UPI003746FC46